MDDQAARLLGEVAGPVGAWRRVVGEFAIPATSVGLDTLTKDAESLFRGEPSRRAIVVSGASGARVVPRERLNQVLVGALGYGRALLARRTLGEVFPDLAVSVSAELPLADAVAVALDRAEVSRYDDLLVQYPGGRFGLAPIAVLLSELADSFADQSLLDSLTGLGNRTRLARDAAALLTDPAVPGVAVFMLDLDHFKSINDALGHNAGDALLSEVAAALHRSAQGTGTVARLGGDEFTALVALSREQLSVEPTLQAGLYALGNRFLQEIRGPYQINGIAITVEASVGFAWSPEHGRDLPTLLRRADTAMYEAKRDGSRVAMWQPRRDTDDAELTLLAELREGIARGELRLHYQPQVTVATGHTAHVEALVRWQHPRRGLLAPGVFLPVAERSDVIYDLTRWTLEEACRQAALWGEGGRPVTVSVNISPRLLIDDDLPNQISSVLDRHRLPARLLTLEITETAVTAHPQRARHRLQQLAALGVGISLDDFGTGYTSLAMLKDLPLTELKVDRTFVAAMRTSQSDAAIVHAVAGLTHQLGMQVVAEGVEDAETQDLLIRCGYDVLQGYYLGRPAAAEVVTAALHQAHRGPADAATATATATEPSPDSRPEQVEQLRLAALARYHVSATLVPFFDDVAALAAQLCGTRSGTVSILDADQQSLGGQGGVVLTTAARDRLLCRYLVGDRNPLIVCDTVADERFSSHPSIVGGRPMRFYAGAPILSADGHTLGGVCALDDTPHSLSESQQNALTVLARITGDRLLAHAHSHDSQQLLTTLNLLLSTTPGVSRDDATAAISATALDLLGADGVTVLLPERARPSELHGHGTVVRTPLQWPADPLKIDIATETNALGIAARRGTPLFLPAADRSPLTSSRLITQLDVRSSFYAPFPLAGAASGMIAAWWQTPRDFLDTITVHHLTTLAAAAAIACGRS